ncbi:unnamed protein product [Durusdinium trenchii]|uniref:Uncharacterized protein n=2 Tax=Durusdinium trenchii TaxID=1381693 RepID=A0ABP0LVJ8_9DINO
MATKDQIGEKDNDKVVDGIEEDKEASVQTAYSSRAEKMRQIRNQQQALDQDKTPPGLMPAGRPPRAQVTIPASIEPLTSEPEPERSTWGRFLFTVACCTSAGRRDGYR